MVLMARFLGRKVILDYRSPVLLNRVAGRGPLLQKLWRLCHVVLVPSAFQRQLVNSMGGRAEWVPKTYPIENVQPRTVRTVQPRVIVDTELEKEHNVISAIRAYYIVKQKYPRIELIIAGDGSQKTALEKLVRTKNIPGIIFTGSLTMARRLELYRECDLVVNCSTIDFLPESITLAFAGGLPVITTPISGGGAVYRNRENIMLTTYNDHSRLAETIIELVEDPDLTEKLSKNGALTSQSVKQLADSTGWTRFYASLAGNRS
jgi:glycosyltransferase involved in cell wall biosynthesis